LQSVQNLFNTEGFKEGVNAKDDCSETNLLKRP